MCAVQHWPFGFPLAGCSVVWESPSYSAASIRRSLNFLITTLGRGGESTHSSGSWWLDSVIWPVDCLTDTSGPSGLNSSFSTGAIGCCYLASIVISVAIFDPCWPSPPSLHFGRCSEYAVHCFLILTQLALSFASNLSFIDFAERCRQSDSLDPYLGISSTSCRWLGRCCRRRQSLHHRPTSYCSSASSVPCSLLDWIRTARSHCCTFCSRKCRRTHLSIRFSRDFSNQYFSRGRFGSPAYGCHRRIVRMWQRDSQTWT